MKQTAIVLALYVCAATSVASGAAQLKPAPTEKPKTASVVTPGVAEAAAPEEIATLVRNWLEAWNRLDGTEAATQRFVDFYTPDATHEVGAPGKGLGPEFFAAPDGIRKMAEEYGKNFSESAFRLETSTADEKAMELIYTAPGPWGGPAVAVPYTGAYTIKATKRRFFYPGVAVLQVNNVGKISHVRVYENREEVAEVRP